MLMRRGTWIVGVVAAASVATTAAVGNYIRPLTQKEKLAESDFVVLARPRVCAADLWKPCTMRVVAAVKGNSGADFLFDRVPRLPEETVHCCEADHLYLLFLKRGPAGYVSVNGPYGAADLTAPRVRSQR